MVSADLEMKSDQTAIRKAQSTNDYLVCADIWLRASLLAHDFIDGDFWRAKQAAMASVYLPSSLVTLAVGAQGEVVAFSAVRGNKLEALFVEPGFWGQGLGRKLLDQIFDGHQELTLTVYAKNKRAVDFYLIRGLEVAGRGLCPFIGAEELTMIWSRNKVPVK